MPNPPLNEDLDLAHQLADAADAITLDRFQALDLVIETKADMTPVSDADTAAERAIRDLLAFHRPDDIVLGEEFGAESTSQDRRWIIDPIDGTKSFISGNPVWATLIALVIGDEVVLSVVSAPAMQQRWWASREAGAFTRNNLGQQRLSVSTIPDLVDASLSFSPRSQWAQRQEQFTNLCSRVKTTTADGDFHLYMLVAQGKADIACEPELSLWDIAALIPIVEEAGGTISGFNGEPGLAAGCAVASNGLLHAATLAFFSPTAP